MVSGSPPMDDPAADLLRLMRGYLVSQAIFAAAELGLADLLTDGPRPPAELAAAVGVPEQSVDRLLRALASVGIFASIGGGGYGLTPMAECLRATGNRAAGRRGARTVFAQTWHESARFFDDDHRPVVGYVPYCRSL